MDNFFQLGPLPLNQVRGSYDLKLVLLSYLVAFAASYIALDMVSRLRDVGNSRLTTTLWLIGGSLAMGAGIWSMHFIGMLAFIMPMPMSYSSGLTAASLLVAIFASCFAMILLKIKTLTMRHLAMGGLILGLAIAAMHYLGMEAMKISMNISYLPSLFFLSFIIAIIASEAALWLALKSNEGPLRSRIRLKLGSAVIMGAAICGMHYIGMEAAIFTPLANHTHEVMSSLDPQLISINVAAVTFFILGLAFFASTYKEILNYHEAKIARQAGMAEVASNVLHNVGNALNSVNISANRVFEKNKNSQLASLVEVSEIIKTNTKNFVDFISKDPRGAILPTYLTDIAQYWQTEQAEINQEMHRLIEKLQHIKSIVAAQQSLCISARKLEEMESLENIIEESIRLIALDFKRYDIMVIKKFEKLAPVCIDKAKLIQVMVNLIKNAKDALQEAAVSPKLLTLKLGMYSPDTAVIEVSDNGIGIAKENLTKIFFHGFTTKMQGHGFGLHASALAASEIGCSLNVESDGSGKGATFRLLIPL